MKRKTLLKRERSIIGALAAIAFCLGFPLTLVSLGWSFSCVYAAIFGWTEMLWIAPITITWICAYRGLWQTATGRRNGRKDQLWIWVRIFALSALSSFIFGHAPKSTIGVVAYYLPLAIVWLAIVALCMCIFECFREEEADKLELSGGS